MNKKHVSVIVPAYNEEETLAELTERIDKSLTESSMDGEIIIVDDGSTDKTGDVANALSHQYSRVETIHHRRNLGKSAAIRTGFRQSEGDVIVTMDADLQYSPEEIPKLVQLIDQGYDLANGWRQERQDSSFRIVASKCYNWLVRRLYHVHIRDNNSGLKALRRETLECIAPMIRKEMHRYIIPLAHHYGYKVAETPVTHNPRRGGKPKYASLGRLITGPIDVITLKLILIFAEKPAILFGLLGALMTIVGAVIGGWLLVLKYVLGNLLTPHLPALLLAILLIVTGVALFMFGFLAEMVATLRAELLDHLSKEKT